MNITQLVLLTNLAEGELSFKEMMEYTGLSRKKLAKSLRMLEHNGYIEKKAFIGNDVIFGITDKGVEELYKHYLFLKKLLADMEFTICSRFEC
ncbi:MAG: marR family transcriptional regulator [Candidatus Aramenus sulfurataquae]|jgi:DNA-binding HxlR family transcriptional regulator|uniref:MarR family transcriptional regulator n=2 Tax=Candidatus Aramenus sulfurataquae TaxID=1326980 RepID=W7L5A0_9CREN|nr:MAG: marR family transcriptional regulator [Candidatus Aramenus sulfurataquae]MCL7343875.1 winged helix-turn-helix domain-containing protein [Candidatus Aramenus sulfurataquae]